MNAETRGRRDGSYYLNFKCVPCHWTYFVKYVNSFLTKYWCRQRISLRLYAGILHFYLFQVEFFVKNTFLDKEEPIFLHPKTWLNVDTPYYIYAPKLSVCVYKCTWLFHIGCFQIRSVSQPLYSYDSGYWCFILDKTFLKYIYKRYDIINKPLNTRLTTTIWVKLRYPFDKCKPPSDKHSAVIVQMGRPLNVRFG